MSAVQWWFSRRKNLGLAPPFPAPAISGISPAANAGSKLAFTLTVNGTHFQNGCTVRWNGANRATTFVSATQVTAAILAADVATAGTAQVSVANPDSQISNNSAFTIT